MKKILCLLFTVVLCILLVACGGVSSQEPPKPAEPTLDVKQEIVNICCDYSNCNSISGFELGTSNKYPTENGYEVIAKGSYWPVDEYGDLGDKMLFDIEFTATWDGTSSYYDIDIDKKYIRTKTY